MKGDEGRDDLDQIFDGYGEAQPGADVTERGHRQPREQGRVANHIQLSGFFFLALDFMMSGVSTARGGYQCTWLLQVRHRG